MPTSAAQTVPTVPVYDYLLSPAGPTTTTAVGLLGKRVKATLQYDKALTIAPDPTVWIAQQTVYSTLTDGNGFWTLNLVPNNRLTPANTYYTIEVEGGASYQIQLTDVGVPGAGWQSSAAGILLNIPAALAPTTSTVGAITATGLITAQAGISITSGGLTVSGGETDTGGLTVDTITYSLAVSRLIPGGTSFSVRDAANANDNLLVTNAGNVTARGSLTVTGGPLTVSAGGAAVTGNSTVTGTLTVTAGLTVNAGGVTATGNSTVTGTLIVSALLTAQAGLTVSGGNLTVTAGSLIFGAAASVITPGATSLTIQTAPVILQNSLTIPPAAAGAAPTTAYGTVPVKIDDQLLAAPAASITFVNPLPTGFRHLMIEWLARGDTAGTNISMLLRFNNDSTAAHYDSEQLFASAAAAAASELLAQTSILIGNCPAASATAGYFGQGEAKVKFYQATTGDKLATSLVSQSRTTGTGDQILHIFSGNWRTVNTAITRVDILASAGNFATGSLFTLWGIP